MKLPLGCCCGLSKKKIVQRALKITRNGTDVTRLVKPYGVSRAQVYAVIARLKEQKK